MTKEQIESIIRPWCAGAFTGWRGKIGSDSITLDEAEDHFSLCMMSMLDEVVPELLALTSATDNS